MLSLLSFISAAPIAASMEVAKPARRRPHPKGHNAEEDGRDAVFWSAASARNGTARGKNCGKRERRPLRPLGGGAANFHHERQRWMRDATKRDGDNQRKKA